MGWEQPGGPRRMAWPRAILCGLLIGIAGGVLSLGPADGAAIWLGYGTGYRAVPFVLASMALAALTSTVLGIALCRRFGGGGMAGALRGIGIACAVVLVLFAGAMGLAWQAADHAPTVGGQPLSLAVELRLPAGAPRPGYQTMSDTVIALEWGPVTRTRQTMVQPRVNEAREEAGHWILPAFVPMESIVFDRLLTVLWNGDTQIYATNLPSRPPAIDTPWSDWIDPITRDMRPVVTARAIAARFRIVRRVAPVIERGARDAAGG